jgi:hypothetical protein
MFLLPYKKLVPIWVIFVKKGPRKAQQMGAHFHSFLRKETGQKSQLAGHKYEKGSKGGQGMKNITDATELSR